MSLFGQHIVGVDITAKSVRVVGIKGHTKSTLLGCKEVLLNDEVITKDGITDTAYVAKMVKEAMAQASPKPLAPGRAITAIPELQLFRKVIELPLLASEHDTLSAIRSEVAQFLPDELELTEIDYQVLGILPDTKTQQIMVVAVSKKIIDDYIKVIQLAGLQPAAIDVRSSALGRALVSPNEKKGVVMVNLESTASIISLYQGGAVRITSSLPMGVDETDDKEVSSHFLAELVDEIDHVIKFYNNRAAGHHDIGGITLTGPGAAFKELKDSLEKQLQLPISLAKPIIAVPAFCDRRFLVAIGCAMYPLGGES